MINISCVTCLFNFFSYFFKKTDGQTLGMETKVCFFWDGGSRKYIRVLIECSRLCVPTNHSTTVLLPPSKNIAISKTVLCPKMKLFFYLPSPLNQSQPFFFTYFLFWTNHTPFLIILTYFLNTRANLKNAYILEWRK